MTVMVYMGYTLEFVEGGGYQSQIDGKLVKFDTAGMWKEYIDYLNRKK